MVSQTARLKPGGILQSRYRIPGQPPKDAKKTWTVVQRGGKGYPFDGTSLPKYGRVLSILQFAPQGQKFSNELPVYLHVQWFQDFKKLYDSRKQPGTIDGGKYSSLVPKEFQRSVHNVMNRLPLDVLQPFYAGAENEWDSTDVILASTIVRKVFMHPIPNFDLPNEGGRIFFLNSIVSFPCPVYAHLMLNDPYVKSIQKAYVERKIANTPY